VSLPAPRWLWNWLRAVEAVARVKAHVPASVDLATSAAVWPVADAGGADHFRKTYCDYVEGSACLVVLPIKCGPNHKRAPSNGRGFYTRNVWLTSDEWEPLSAAIEWHKERS
jgi:hypothetical protein